MVEHISCCRWPEVAPQPLTRVTICQISDDPSPEFRFEAISVTLINDVGVETVMWGLENPHTDGIWPESSKYIEEQFAGLSPDIVHKITLENAAKFYGLIN